MNINLQGKKIEVSDGQTGFDVAKSIDEALTKNAIAYDLNGKQYDLRAVVKESGDMKFILKTDVEAMDILNHSAAHLLAQAVKRLYPSAQLGFGPSIEEGFFYDILFKEPITSEDFPAIEKEMKNIVKENLKIERIEVSKEEAKKLFKDEKYKLKHIDEIEGNISVYKQGEYADLCFGPHVPSTGYIKAFKIMSLAGAYFQGDKNNEQLTRIYGTSFFSKEQLDEHLVNLEERKKRDHRKLGKELDLFMISDYGPGFPFWLPNGMIVRKTLENYWYKVHEQEGYKFCQTPIMLSKELWETSGHWANYKENMYTTKIDDREFAIKPMNCPGGMLIYKNSLHSYRDLPLRLAELGLVHRHEASGALNGLFRVRTFTQDDAHIFMREDQLESEIQKLLSLYDKMYKVFNLSYNIVLSTRPENKYIGSIETWNKAEAILKQCLEDSNVPYKINPGDGAFYGPKLDFKLKDSMGRIWQCGTIQLDMNLPERFDLTYTDNNGNKIRPIMLHRALYGSIERFIGILIEHFGGAFPTWLAPVQVKLLPVSLENHMEYALKIKEQLNKLNIRVDIDDRNEKLGYKLREAQVKKIPFTIVIGDNEVKDNSLTYRRLKSQDQVTLSIDDFIKLIVDEIDNKIIY